MNTTTTRHCEARIGWRPGAFRLEPVMCGQSVAVAPVIDATGTVRGACPIEGHREQVIRRFGQEPSACCGAGGSTPHWVHCPERPAPGELMEAYGR